MANQSVAQRPRAVTPELHPDLERLALLGWHLVPATSTKKGLFKGYLDAATHDLDQLAAWQAEYPGCCWKVRPEGSGVFFLDVDVPGVHRHDGVASLKSLCDKHGPLPPRPHGRSPSGGHLLVFRDTGAPINRGTNRPALGIDTLHVRLCATVAPSRRNGGAYQWLVAPWEIAPPPAPDWLRKLCAPPPAPARPKRPKVLTADGAGRALARTIDNLIRVQEGGRNAALNRAAYIAGGLCGAGALDEADAIRALYAAGRHIGLTDAECRATIRSGFQKGEARPMDRAA